MKKALILIAAIAAAACLAPSRADALLLPPERGVSEGLNAAREHWGVSPPCVVEIVYETLPPERANVIARAFRVTWTDYATGELRTRCQIRLNLPTWGGAWKLARCAVIVHEWGHLLELRFEDNPTDPAHSADPTNVMYGHLTIIPPECLRAGPKGYRGNVERLRRKLRAAQVRKALRR